MKELKKQIIANSGLNKNNVYFSEECLNNCVKNIREESLVITNEFYKNEWLGYMTNFKYKNGKIFADIHLDKNFNLFENYMDEKVVRCAFEVIEKEGNNPIEITKCRLLEGGLIEKFNDAEADLL